MKILVTGANGQLGNELRRQLDKSFAAEVFYTDVDTLDLTDAKSVEAYCGQPRNHPHTELRFLYRR